MAVSDAETLDLLAGAPLFAALGEDELAQVAEAGVPRRFLAGEVVFREGEWSDTCYVVRSGRVRASRAHTDGRTLTVAGFGPGEVFGELAMFEAEPRSATVEAVEDTQCIALLAADLRRLLRAHPEIALSLIASLARRLRDTNERLTRQSFQTVQSRVAFALSELVGAAQADGAGEDDVLVTATQADLARLAGASRESASRFLASLERAGLITQRRGRLIVHEPARLAGYVY